MVINDIIFLQSFELHFFHVLVYHYIYIMKLRSHAYPDQELGYVNTTRYDKEEHCLDIGYQRLKILDLAWLATFQNLHKLYLDCNLLTQLPEPHHLPHLTVLSCASNRLFTLPYYVHLEFLNCSYNHLRDIDVYASASSLIYVDASHNVGLTFHQIWPYCTQLFIQNLQLKQLAAACFPHLIMLDCSHNALKVLPHFQQIIELDCSYNDLNTLPSFAYLKHLRAQHNQFTILSTFAHLETCNVNHNRLKQIHTQPQLKQLFARHNMLTQLPSLARIIHLEVDSNQLHIIQLPSTCQHVLLFDNVITQMELTAHHFATLKELQIDFKLYVILYDTYAAQLESVLVRIHSETLQFCLNVCDWKWTEKMQHQIHKLFNKIVFKKREAQLRQIAKQMTSSYFNVHANIESLSSYEIMHRFLTKLYYKCITITLYFNGYVE